MAHYTKEKNIIRFVVGGQELPYSIDINTARLTGARGTMLKTCPKKRALVEAVGYYWSSAEHQPHLACALSYFLDGYRSTEEYSHRFAQILSVADRLDNIDLPAKQYLDCGDMIFVGKHFKDYLAWVRAHAENLPSFREFKREMGAKEAYLRCGLDINVLDSNTIETLMSLRPQMTRAEASLCTYYLTNGYVLEYDDYNGIRRIVRYLEMCEVMGVAPRKTNNFMREYVETNRAYQARKMEYDNAKLVLNYAKHAKAWEFECGDFVVTIPTCGQDIVDEGAKMHHCVGGYVSRVVNNETYICFVRHKNDIDTPYITCQVYLDGQIGQYFLAYDRNITSNEDIAFRQAFQAHLHEVWG